MSDKADLEREAFEKIYRCPHNVQFIQGGNYYAAQEPYVWGGDKAAGDINRHWETWQARSKEVKALREALAESDENILESSHALEHQAAVIGRLERQNRQLRDVLKQIAYPDQTDKLGYLTAREFLEKLK
jgi:hypothetical protein